MNCVQFRFSVQIIKRELMNTPMSSFVYIRSSDIHSLLIN